MRREGRIVKRWTMEDKNEVRTQVCQDMQMQLEVASHEMALERSRNSIHYSWIDDHLIPLLLASWIHSTDKHRKDVHSEETNELETIECKTNMECQSTKDDILSIREFTNFYIANLWKFPIWKLQLGHVRFGNCQVGSF